MAVSARYTPTTQYIQAQIETLWPLMATDPGDRALMAARLCMAAPELVPDARCRDDIHVVRRL